MKCPKCWAEKAYVRRVDGIKGFLMQCLLLMPMKCHHCYHRFTVSWFVTIGKQIEPSRPRIVPMHRTDRPSYAAQHQATAELPPQKLRGSRKPGRRAKKDAA